MCNLNENSKIADVTGEATGGTFMSSSLECGNCWDTNCPNYPRNRRTRPCDRRNYYPVPYYPNYPWYPWYPWSITY
jgi:hypothetical protein